MLQAGLLRFWLFLAYIRPSKSKYTAAPHLGISTAQHRAPSIGIGVVLIMVVVALHITIPLAKAIGAIDPAAYYALAIGGLCAPQPLLAIVEQKIEFMAIPAP